jgi:hypothetical protein
MLSAAEQPGLLPQCIHTSLQTTSSRLNVIASHFAYQVQNHLRLQNFTPQHAAQAMHGTALTPRICTRSFHGTAQQIHGHYMEHYNPSQN